MSLSATLALNEQMSGLGGVCLPTSDQCLYPCTAQAGERNLCDLQKDFLSLTNHREIGQFIIDFIFIAQTISQHSNSNLNPAAQKYVYQYSFLFCCCKSSQRESNLFASEQYSFIICRILCHSCTYTNAFKLKLLVLELGPNRGEVGRFKALSVKKKSQRVILTTVYFSASK